MAFFYCLWFFFFFNDTATTEIYTVGNTLSPTRRSSDLLRLTAAQPVHRHEHELAVERLDDLGSLERHRVVGQQLVETERRRPRRRLHAVAHRVGSLFLRLRVLAL